MLRYFFCSVICIILLICCSSVKISEKKEESPDFSERAESAVFMLSCDITDASENSAINTDAIKAFLPDSYTIYSSYFPLYKSIMTEYIQAIEIVLDETNENLDSMFMDAFEEIKSISPSLVTSDTALVDVIRSRKRDVFASYLGDVLHQSKALSDAFVPSYEAFNSIKKAYERLSSVGYSLSLPSPSPVDVHALALFYTDSYFARLAEFEKEIKNQRVDSSGVSVYSIFWEE